MSWAPVYWATWTAKPVLTALSRPPISQMDEVLIPTAAVALAPREPTMAVSTYWTAVNRICSKMAGQERRNTVRTGFLLPRMSCWFAMGRKSSIVAFFMVRARKKDPH